MISISHYTCTLLQKYTQMYSSPNTCKPSFESPVPRLFEYRVGIEPVIKPLVQQEDVDDLRDLRDLRDLKKAKKDKKDKKDKKIQKKHKKTKKNKIFAALCESSDDDEYSRRNISEDINYESKIVNAYDPASVIEHKEDSDI